MELNSKEVQSGERWFIWAGLVAVLLSLFLASLDDKLTYSTSEIELGDTLRELRMAQTTLDTHSTDPRQ